MPLAPSPSAWALPWGQLAVCVACTDTAPRTAGDGTGCHGAPDLLPNTRACTGPAGRRWRPERSNFHEEQKRKEDRRTQPKSGMELAENRCH